jgi:hypothetical protein
LGEAGEIANAVGIAVIEGADVELVGVDRAARAMGKVNGPEPSKISWFFWQVIHGGGCSFVRDDGRWTERNAGLEADEKPSGLKA